MVVYLASHFALDVRRHIATVPLRAAAMKMGPAAVAVAVAVADPIPIRIQTTSYSVAGQTAWAAWAATVELNELALVDSKFHSPPMTHAHQKHQRTLILSFYVFSTTLPLQLRNCPESLRPLDCLQWWSSLQQPNIDTQV